MNVTIGGIARTVEITSFDKLGDVKVCMLTTTADGSVGFQQLNQEVIDAIDSKAAPDGNYEDMVVGSAEQLLSTQYDTDSVPYAFRKSPYGDREFDEIVGGSIAWNQQRTDTDVSKTADGITTAYSSATHKISITNNSRTTNYSSGSNQITLVDAVTVGHKYLVDCDKNESGVGITVLNNNSQVLGFVPVNSIFTFSTAATKMALRVSKDYDFVTAHPVNDVFSFYFNIYDLTQMFGTSVADAIYAMEQSTSGSGVAFFRGLFPKSYYAYNAGQLISVSGLSAHKMTGFNQWDEDWELGYWNNGVKANSTINIRNKNLIPVIPNTAYYVKYPDVNGARIQAFDANKDFISDLGYKADTTFTTPNNCWYIAFYTNASSSITAYNNNICINISGERNGQYEPYESHSYALDDSLTLRGVPKLVDNKVQFDGDVYANDGTVTRKYGIITLNGTESWTISGASSGEFYTPCHTLVKKTNYTGSIVCDKLQVTSNAYSDVFFNGQYVVSVYPDTNNAYPNQNWIYLKTTDAVTDANALKTWLASNPVTLIYELATPTIESAEPYVNPQICNEYGTEEYVSAEQSGVTMIVGHNTKYPQNLRKKIEGLPWNFSNLIAPTEVTNKASRNYTVGSFLIMNNTLYKVTSAIANGGTITVGSNVSATTIMQEILAL